MEKYLSGPKKISLDRTSLYSGNYRALIEQGNYSPYFWHKIEVTGGQKYKNVVILDSVIQHCLPEQLIPVKYQKEASSSSFLVSQCKTALIKLCSSNLLVPMPDQNMLGITIHLNFTDKGSVNIDIEHQMEILCHTSRMSMVEFVVDLSYFPLDPGLRTIYCPLWAPFNMKSVLYAVRMNPKIQVVNLSHNKLTTLEHLQPLLQLKNLNNLILSHNLLDWEGFSHCPAFRLKKISLDNNPLCQNVSPHEYIKRIKELLPTVDRIDNKEIPNWSFFIGRNCLINKKSQVIVDQFLYHYFSYFLNADSRALLINMYHRQAAISVSTSFLPNETTSVHTGISGMKEISRNIYKITDYGKAVDSFSQGHIKVLSILSLLPHVTLDQTSLTVDVPIYQEDQTVMVETMGVFQVPQNFDIYSINFTFVLSHVGGGQWQIMNHLIGITNASTLQAEKAFNQAEEELVPMENPLVLTESEMVAEFQGLTKLKTSECSKFLKEAHWNLEDALQTFVDLYKGGQVAADSF